MAPPIRLQPPSVDFQRNNVRLCSAVDLLARRSPIYLAERRESWTLRNASSHRKELTHNAPIENTNFGSAPGPWRSLTSLASRSPDGRSLSAHRDCAENSWTILRRSRNCDLWTAISNIENFTKVRFPKKSVLTIPISKRFLAITCSEIFSKFPEFSHHVTEKSSR